jgi:hypothetical protein
MSNTIFLIGGGKGGVGKSLMSMAVLDFLQANGQRPFLVETDTSVPDVFKTYWEAVGGELVNLDEREGWIGLVNLFESSPERTFVINTGARNQTGMSNFGRTLSKALPELGRKLVVLWMIDREREGLELRTSRKPSRKPRSTSSGTCMSAPRRSSSSAAARR